MRLEAPSGGKGESIQGAVSVTEGSDAARQEQARVKGFGGQVPCPSRDVSHLSPFSSDRQGLTPPRGAVRVAGGIHGSVRHFFKNK